MKIEQRDIDCLIDLSVWLKSMIDGDNSGIFGPRFIEWHERVRKIYILLLMASDKGQLDLSSLTKKGVPEDCSTAQAIRLLCPHIGQN